MLSRLIGLISTTGPLLLMTITAAVAADPGKVTARTAYLTTRSGNFGFLGMCCLEIDEKPAAAFGLYQPPDGKPQYTYLILFKPDPKAERGIGGGGDGSSQISSDGGVTCDVTLNAHPGGKDINWRLALERDAKTVTKSVLTFGDKEYGKDGPRVFLVDLSQEKPTPIAVKHSPSSVPTFTDEDAWGKAILAARAELIDKSPESKKFFGDAK